MSISCPKCGVEVSSAPEREWRFQQYQVSRFRCERGDKFNLYSGLSKTFTIPRAASDRNQCKACKTHNPREAIFCKNCGAKL
jgi:hypothetical protein